MERKSYIYKVTNLVDGKVYIGQSIDPIRRIKKHIDVRSKQGYLLNYAVKKYGVENFLFEVIKSEVPIDQINETEIQCIKEHNCKVPNGYNLTDGGEGTVGRLVSEKTRKTVSDKLIGHTVSEETRLKIKTARAKQVMYKWSDDQKLKASIRHTGKVLSESTKNKLRQYHGKNHSMFGKHLSEEHKEKLRISNLGQKRDLVARQNMSKAKAGKPRKPLSKETKDKIAAAHIGKKNSLEHNLKMAASKVNGFIVQKDQNNNIINVFRSHLEAAIATGFLKDRIKTAVHTGYLYEGYLWELKKENKN